MRKLIMWNIVTLDGFFEGAKRWDMRQTNFISLIAALFLAATSLSAQITNGIEPRLPPPYATPVVNNPARVVPAPLDFQPRVPPSFKVSVFARDFDEPRWLAVAPNGDVFVADAKRGQVIVLRDTRHLGKAESREIFADHLTLPFGIAFHEGYVYIGTVNEVIRFRFDPKISKRLGGREHILDLPRDVPTDLPPGIYAHWTRALAFSHDGKKLFIAVGAKTNASLEPEPERAVIIVCDSDGKNSRIYASGVRNSLGIGFNPESGQLWAAVMERGNLGDDLPPDYFTHIQEEGFYGFPYSYIGHHLDPKVQLQQPELVAKAIVPDLLLEAHSSPMQFVFYEGRQFPAQYRHGAFVARHGSSNRSVKVGYDVVFIPFHNGKPASGPTPFFSGLVPDPHQREVYGRPVGVAVATDGSLLISDDGGNLIWSVTYQKGSKSSDQRCPCGSATWRIWFLPMPHGYCWRDYLFRGSRLS